MRYWHAILHAFVKNLKNPHDFPIFVDEMKKFLFSFWHFHILVIVLQNISGMRADDDDEKKKKSPAHFIIYSDGKANFIYYSTSS